MRTGWDGGVAKTCHGDLSKEAQDAVKSLRKYFANRENNLYRIRNKVSFHYDKEVSMAFLESVDGQTQHDILAGDGSENLFHIFPETAMNFVLFGI